MYTGMLDVNDALDQDGGGLDDDVMEREWTTTTISDRILSVLYLTDTFEVSYVMTKCEERLSACLNLPICERLLGWLSTAESSAGHHPRRHLAEKCPKLMLAVHEHVIEPWKVKIYLSLSIFFFHPVVE